MITVEELMELFIDPESQQVEIWDCATEKTVYSGLYSDMPENIKEQNIWSIDNIVFPLYSNGGGKMTLNIDTSED